MDDDFLIHKSPSRRIADQNGRQLELTAAGAVPSGLVDISGNPITNANPLPVFGPVDATIVSPLTTNVDRNTNLDGTDGVTTASMIFGRVSDSIVRNARLDASTDALITVDYPHHDLHDGSYYTYQDVVVLGNGGSQVYLITQPDTDKHGHWGYNISFEDGQGTLELFRGADRTGTTLQSVFNSNDNFPDAAGVTIHKGVTGGTTDGVRVDWVTKGSGRSFGGTAGTVTERVLGRNIKYLLRVTNNITTINTVNVGMGWYEHTPRN